MALVNIRDAIRAIVAVQESLEITVPTTVKAKKAFPYSPPQNEVITANLPAWTNGWELTGVDRPSGDVSFRYYTVHMQLHVAQATNGDDSRAADIATAFMEAIHTALESKNAAGIGGMKLVGEVGGVLVPTVEGHDRLRGVLTALGDPPSRTIGLDLFLDLQILNTSAHS